MAYLLALDTATRYTGLALLAEGDLLAELNWRSHDSQTTELTPRLSQLLAWHGLAPADVAAIAVSLGPGSFTGVRIALSVAKGIAVAQGTPLVGVSTLDATAYPFLRAAGSVAAVVQAGRGRVCWALYADRPPEPPAPEVGWAPLRLGGWQGWRTAFHLSDPQGLAQQVTRPTLFVGELTPALVETWVGPQALMSEAVASGRRAAVLGYLGWLRWQAGDVDDPASLSPIYLREP
ncbi:MAG: tRNA (adenosine(37)-N6)-threonylcarbamoyltransferase complex dimerization subunit type 1 TsaB [Caldilineales bacterium]|nr:tRNA (adenosine(37)-N6)-threonylcarbamoyltransferase complex dimerization subunit type 1 TsaB [Caldilineales bacterium]MDW8316802.1 tRNA (adenosine(37)-N6)-threonylcarbamoyltransferase complex dimerization subunit type 1 TsaB [Anaerolineae bacterium]